MLLIVIVNTFWMQRHYIVVRFDSILATSVGVCQTVDVKSIELQLHLIISTSPYTTSAILDQFDVI